MQASRVITLYGELAAFNQHSGGTCAAGARYARTAAADSGAKLAHEDFKVAVFYCQHITASAAVTVLATAAADTSATLTCPDLKAWRSEGIVCANRYCRSTSAAVAV